MPTHLEILRSAKDIPAHTKSKVVEAAAVSPLSEFVDFVQTRTDSVSGVEVPAAAAPRSVVVLIIKDGHWSKTSAHITRDGAVADLEAHCRKRWPEVCGKRLLPLDGEDLVTRYFEIVADGCFASIEECEVRP